LFYVVYYVMAAAGETRDFVSLHGRQQIRVRRVDGPVFKGSGAQVAVQTLAIVIGFVETNGIVGLTEILHVNVVQPVEFGPESPEHRVIGVTRIAGLIGRDAVILKVGGG
jgi:hypothetical protein